MTSSYLAGKCRRRKKNPSSSSTAATTTTTTTGELLSMLAAKWRLENEKSKLSVFLP